jgi:hypothetical protein
MIKITENKIIIDREKLRDWLLQGPEEPVPWEEGNEEREKSEKEPGYVTGDGEKKPFPNPAPGDEEVEEEVTEDDVEGVDLFEPGPNGIGGKLQDADRGSEKIKEMRDWLKDNKFNYRNFCLFLSKIKNVAGWDLKTPVIGKTTKGDPSIFQLATRYYTYWKSASNDVAKEYKKFLREQLLDLGVKIKLVEDMMEGEEVDPANLPKGIEVK